ncbi:MAG: BatA domain-containing protein [Armatimonadetes bacterium]|nr:BatA domain-containing protein [Armatimonadota bacterium]MDW8122793.1 BatA domain-containing protein [Armatimonadota bacterium]
MIFGQPQYLPFLLAAVLPILIHLIARRFRKVEPLPTLRFLEEAVRMAEGRRRLRDLILLVLRTLAILFIMAALCRPYVKTTVALPVAPSAAALVLDNTVSMSATTGTESWWDLARDWCRKFLEAWSGEVTVLSADTAWNPVMPFTKDDQVAWKAVESLSFSKKAHHLTLALQAADRVLSRHRAVFRLIVLVTDGQSEPIRSQGLPVLSHPVAVVIVRNEDVPANVRVEGTVLSPMDPGRLPVAVAVLRNMSGRSVKGEVLVRVADREAYRRSVHLRPSSQHRMRVVIPKGLAYIRTSSGTNGLIQWRPDRNLDVLAADDAVPFQFRPQFFLKIGVDLADGKERTLLTLRATGLKVVDRVGNNLSAFDAVVTSPPKDEGKALRLANWVAEGRGAVVFVESDLSPLWKILNLKIRRSEGPSRRVNFVDEDWSPLRGLALALRMVWVRSFWTVTSSVPIRDAKATIKGGFPLILEHRYGAGRFLFVFTSLAGRESNLAYTSVFLPLIHRLSVYAAYNGFVLERQSAFSGLPGAIPEAESEMRLSSLPSVERTLAEQGSLVLLAQRENRLHLLRPPWKDLSSVLLLVGAFLVAVEGFVGALLWRAVRQGPTRLFSSA